MSTRPINTKCTTFTFDEGSKLCSLVGVTTCEDDTENSEAYTIPGGISSLPFPPIPRLPD